MSFVERNNYKNVGLEFLDFDILNDLHKLLRKWGFHKVQFL